MTNDSFIFSSYKESKVFREKYNIADRLTEILFECIYLDNEKIFIRAQFQVPGLWKVKYPPGPMCCGLRDQQIAELLDLSYEVFKDKMINKFHAYLEDSPAFGCRLYFSSLEDALNAFNWMASIELSYRLQKYAGIIELE